ncbi:MAG: transaldolase [Crocinitomicaceae bacterium]|nr:transaldolase [Crocinitomicaceae bacterium]|tara:strand:- start:363 stop:1382 length:1020 start_codon:yes stop_codon:yes gene_type:complete
MELYLDSADINEIKEAFELGFLSGLTTTPTFMHRHGITDIDGMILELAKIVPVLQIEALGETAEEIVAEARRQDALGLDREKTVYKIPISMEGVKACRILREEGYLVNIHLVYTLQQAYMAMEAGATYVCPLVGRLQDQGTDALSLVQQCVDAVNYYGYDTKIMFSSVRHTEHVRNAINIGVHTVTVPWKVMKQLTENHFTEIGTRQFFEHTRLMTVRVKDVINENNPTVTVNETITDCLVKMTAGGFGAVTIVDDNGAAAGIFTDGDLRRLIEQEGAGAVSKKVGELELSTPLSVEGGELLIKAQEIFSAKKVDELVVTENGKVIGMMDVQDLVKVKS